MESATVQWWISLLFPELYLRETLAYVTRQERPISQKATKNSATYPFFNKYAACKLNPTEDNHYDVNETLSTEQVSVKGA